MKKLFIFLIPIIFFYGCEKPKVVSIREKPESPVIATKTNLVKIQNGDLTPAMIKITKGSEVTFQNLGSGLYTIVSDPHPSHSQFIDLYKVLHLNETYNYQFNKIGTFGVHLEENTSVTVKIVVE